jgi:hypothetical protein
MDQINLQLKPWLIIEYQAVAVWGIVRYILGSYSIDLINNF